MLYILESIIKNYKEEKCNHNLDKITLISLHIFTAIITALKLNENILSMQLLLP